MLANLPCVEAFQPGEHFTRNHISSVNSVIVLNKAEAVHELDLRDGPSAILEMVLDVFLCNCEPRSESQHKSSKGSHVAYEDPSLHGQISSKMHRIV